MAVVTNISRNHLDRHGTMRAYIAAKKNIIRYQGPGDAAVLNADDPEGLWEKAARARGSRVVWYSARGAVEEGVWADGSVLVLARAAARTGWTWPAASRSWAATTS